VDVSVDGPHSDLELAELRNLLVLERRAVDRFLEAISDPKATALDLVERAEELDPVVDRRLMMMRQLREQASDLRRREEERSIRQFVLRALEVIGTPQPAGFVQEYVWATERVDLDTRGFGALRRDEARSWRRRPGHRLAYVVPALDSEGHAQARWMARSDWSLPRRLAVPGADRLFDLTKLLSLFSAREGLLVQDLGDSYLPLIRRYGTGLLSTPPPSSQGDSDQTDWLREVREATTHEIDALRVQVEDSQAAAAGGLAFLEPEQQLWGV
jgi:hypothetical protein